MKISYGLTELKSNIHCHVLRHIVVYVNFSYSPVNLAFMIIYIQNDVLKICRKRAFNNYSLAS